MNNIKTIDIEIAVSTLFGTRKNIIVPNISYGAELHECDLLSINTSGYATEVEIKVSKSDLKHDFTKKHKHKSDKIKNLYYAIPEDLLDIALELVPSYAGIIICNREHEYNQVVASYYRCAKPIHKYRKMTTEEIAKISKLGCMRIWNLKKSLNSENARKLTFYKLYLKTEKELKELKKTLILS